MAVRTSYFRTQSAKYSSMDSLMRRSPSGLLLISSHLAHSPFPPLTHLSPHHEMLETRTGHFLMMDVSMSADDLYFLSHHAPSELAKSHDLRVYQLVFISKPAKIVQVQPRDKVLDVLCCIVPRRVQ